MPRTEQLFPSVLTGKGHQGLGRFVRFQRDPFGNPIKNNRSDPIQRKASVTGMAGSRAGPSEAGCRPYGSCRHFCRRRSLMDLEGFKSLRRVARDGGVPISVYGPTFSLTILSPL